MVTVVDSEPEEPAAAPARSMELTLHEIEGEPLVLDTDLGRELGMARPTNIIPRLLDQNPWAHWRSPIDMMRHG